MDEEITFEKFGNWIKEFDIENPYNKEIRLDDRGRYVQFHCKDYDEEGDPKEYGYGEWYVMDEPDESEIRLIPYYSAADLSLKGPIEGKLCKSYEQEEIFVNGKWYKSALKDEERIEAIRYIIEKRKNNGI